jgi:hypothetical protein
MALLEATLLTRQIPVLLLPKASLVRRGAHVIQLALSLRQGPALEPGAPHLRMAPIQVLAYAENSAFGEKSDG